jgi:hypothetical protein
MPHIYLAFLQSIVVACLQDDPATAKRLFAETAAILDFREVVGTPLGAGFVLVSFGLVACIGGEPAKGLPAMAVAFRLFGQVGVDMASMESDPLAKLAMQALEKAKAQLGPAAFQVAWADGQQLTVEQALALAMEDLGDAPAGAAGAGRAQ